MKLAAKAVSASIESRTLRKVILKHVGAYGISYCEFETLFALSNKQKLQPSQISTYLIQEPGAVSKTIRLLENKGYVDVVHDDEDRRRVFVSITKAGKSLVDSINILV